MNLRGNLVPRMLGLWMLLGSVLYAEDSAYVFTYFVGNGEDGLHLLGSENGLEWEALNHGEPLFSSPLGMHENLFRDPCVTLGPDGTYHLVWTTGWNENTIGYAASRDFIKWSKPRAIPVMAHEPTVRNSWAPEVFYDKAAEEFVIFWASTIPDRFPATAGASEKAYNHRMYATTTKDWAHFTPTRLFYDPGFSVIDATLVPTRRGLHWIVKDETVVPPRKHLRISTAITAQGPYGELSAPFTPDGVWVEGPTAIEIDGAVVVYYDAYIEKHYGAMRSVDLNHWEDISDQLVMPFEGTPKRVRHGTVIAVPRELLDRLRDPRSWSQ